MYYEEISDLAKKYTGEENQYKLEKEIRSLLEKSNERVLEAYRDQKDPADAASESFAGIDTLDIGEDGDVGLIFITRNRQKALAALREYEKSTGTDKTEEPEFEDINLSYYLDPFREGWLQYEFDSQHPNARKCLKITWE